MNAGVPTYGSANVSLPARADIAIIGGGVMGLGLAYELLARAKRSGRALKVVVVERAHLVDGASGRNGGGVRMQWGDADNVRLMMESIAICRGLAQSLGINVWFRQGGYLFLARSERSERKLVRNADLHREVGAPTRLLDAAGARAIVPALDTREVRLASFNPHDGVVFPWAFVWGYAAKAVSLGAIVRTHAEVVAMEPAGDGLRLSLSTGEKLQADRVVNATGAWSNRINALVGVTLPNHPHRHEILSSEPVKPFLDPLVVDFDTGLYFSQSTRGELVTGITLPDPPGEHARDGLDGRSSLRFLAAISRTLIRVLPVARTLRPLRQWAGPYDVSPDGDAIVGSTPGVPSLIQLCGFTGHGFMMAPATVRLLAASLLDDVPHPMLQRWDPARFVEGRSRVVEDMIIG